MSAPAIYHFDPVSGELLGASAADIDPVATSKAGETRYFGPPAHATAEPPPEPRDGQASRYRDGAWTQVEDHRGERVFDTQSGTEVDPHKIPLGPLPDTMTLEPRPSALHVWRDGGWTEDEPRKEESEAARAEAALFETDRASIATMRRVLIELGEGRAIPAAAIAELKARELLADSHREKIEIRQPHEPFSA